MGKVGADSRNGNGGVGVSRKVGHLMALAPPLAKNARSGAPGTRGMATLRELPV